LVVERLIDKQGEVVAQWILLTNVDKSVSVQTVATWYYYRWKIESYFKLLKSAGFNLEKWQQQTPQAIFRRLLIASQQLFKIRDELSGIMGIDLGLV